MCYTAVIMCACWLAAYRSINALQQKCKFRRHGCCPVHLHVEGNYVFEEVCIHMHTLYTVVLLVITLISPLLMNAMSDMKESTGITACTCTSTHDTCTTSCCIDISCSTVIAAK
jgi:hypothetical protein